jgi:hypothetical protein
MNCLVNGEESDKLTHLVRSRTCNHRLKDVSEGAVSSESRHMIEHIGSERDGYIHDVLIWEVNTVTVEDELGPKYVFSLSSAEMARIAL